MEMGVKELKELLATVQSALFEEHHATKMLLLELIGYKYREAQEDEHRRALRSKPGEASGTYEGNNERADANAKSINKHGKAENNMGG